MHSALQKPALGIKSIIYFIGLSLIGLAWWTDKYFGAATVDQAIYTVRFGIEGALSSDATFIKRLLFWCCLLPAAITLSLVFLEKKIYPSFNLIFKYLLPYFLLCMGIAYVSYQYSVIDFIKAHAKSGTDYFKANYINPQHVTFHATQPKSLIMIYVESLENSYSENKLFGQDLLHRLNEYKKGGISFSNYQSTYGTDWTIAGIVSTQCGVPLKSLTIFGHNREGHMVNHFLPKAVCLGDILSAHGYTNIFMNGPSLEFAGVGKFFNDHHYREIYGKDEWLAKGIKLENMNHWGLFDDDLLAQAKIRLGELMRAQQLFNLTILTVDTHGPAGHLSKTCKQKGFHDFTGIVECTANQLADFVSYVKEQGWLDKVTIVIVGDHLAMKNAVNKKLKLNNHRTIFNLMITNTRLTKNTNNVVGFDLFPSIMESLGFQFEGHRLGLGYSAFSPPQSIQPADRYVDMAENLMSNSETYNQLW